MRNTVNYKRVEALSKLKNKIKRINTPELLDLLEEYIDSLELPNDCAFQYSKDGLVIVDRSCITLNEAKALFNEYYDEVVDDDWNNVEIAIWINMDHPSDYKETLIHLHNPYIINGELTETVYYPKFKLDA